MAALETLAERLKVPADHLNALKGYDDKQLSGIDGVIRGALEAEDSAFTKAVEDSLDILPRLIRPIARKMMLGG